MRIVVNCVVSEAHDVRSRWVKFGMMCGKLNWLIEVLDRIRVWIVVYERMDLSLGVVMLLEDERLRVLILVGWFGWGKRVVRLGQDDRVMCWMVWGFRNERLWI